MKWHMNIIWIEIYHGGGIVGETKWHTNTVWTETVKRGVNEMKWHTNTIWFRLRHIMGSKRNATRTLFRRKPIKGPGTKRPTNTVWTETYYGV